MPKGGAQGLTIPRSFLNATTGGIFNYEDVWVAIARTPELLVNHINTLRGTTTTGTTTGTTSHNTTTYTGSNTGTTTRKRRTLSPQARAKVARAQKERWAQIKAQRQGGRQKTMAAGGNNS